MELKRILIVEDDADIAAIERDYLELGGYAVFRDSLPFII